MLSSKYRVLKEATKLDVFNLAYEFSCEALNFLSLEPSSLPRKGVITRLGIFVWHLVSGIRELWQRKGPAIPLGSFVFFVRNKNEQDSLMTVFANVPQAFWVGYNSNAANELSFFQAHLLSCLYFPLVAYTFLRSKGYKRKSYSYIFDHYCLIYGLYAVARMWLRKIKPRAIVLSNNTYTYHRVMAKAAQDEGIVTVYIPHASAVQNFPSLDFDYALLEGSAALDVYAGLGSSETKVFLVGIPKHDSHFSHIRGLKELSALGVCINGLDPLDRVEELIRNVRQDFPALSMILRPHNGDRRVNDWKKIAQKYDMQFSNSRKELSFDFLARVDAIIAGDSNILLEAALMNVGPLYYDFALTHLDCFGFERNGLVQYLSQPPELSRIIKEVSQSTSVRPRAKYYCATIGTAHDGRSGAVAAGLMKELTSPNGSGLREWRRIPNVALEAYELSDGDAIHNAGKRATTETPPSIMVK